MAAVGELSKNSSDEIGLSQNASNVGFNRGEESVTISNAPVGDPYTFIGFGKQELLLHANEPYWVRLRWILFICCWIAWIGLLVGAVLMIVLAPKCGGGGGKSLATNFSSLDSDVDFFSGKQSDEMYTNAAMEELIFEHKF